MRDTERAVVGLASVAVASFSLWCLLTDRATTPTATIQDDVPRGWMMPPAPHSQKADEMAMVQESPMFGGPPQPRRPLKLQVLDLEGTPKTRVNTVSKKEERTYTVSLRQERMSLYMPTSKNKAKTTPFYKPGEPHMHDMFMMAAQFDLSKMPAAHIVEFQPVVTRLAGMTFDNSIVHHMDLYLCTDELDRLPVETDEMPAMEGNVACDSMPWAYDRDAKGLVLPDHVGVAIGKGTPYKRMALEWHYLLDKDGLNGLKNIKDHFTDHSGVDLTVTPDLRQHSAATFGFIGGSMTLPAGHKRYDYTIATSKDRLARMLRHDVAKYGEVHPVALHLHMHNHGRQSWVEHHRDGKNLGEVGRIDQYKGFGVDQTFFVVDGQQDPASLQRSTQQATEGHLSYKPDKAGIRHGDQLVMHCVYDTRCKYAMEQMEPGECEKATEDIQYGLSHGDEMCGNLLMYYPHDPKARFWKGMVLGYMKGDLEETGTVLE